MKGTLHAPRGVSLPALVVVLAAASLRAEDTTALDRALVAAAAFTYGKDSAPLELIEREVLTTSSSPERRALLEEKLLAALKSASTRDARELFCRMLRAIGTARSVPQLEGLLADEELSSLGRLALERIEAPEAGQALLRSLQGARGKRLVGLLGSLGRRREAGAIPAVEGLLASEDELVARAAAAALGEIGGERSVQILERARGLSRGRMRTEVEDALLVSAERLLAGGSPGAAAAIYRSFLGDRSPPHHRLAALGGLVTARAPEAFDALSAALKDSSSEIRRGAIEATRAPGIRAADDPALTERLAALLPSLPADTAALLVSALAQRGGAAARTAVLGAARDARGEVRGAALEALGVVGGPSEVPLLLEAARGKDDDAATRSARASLLELRGPDVDAAIVAVASSGEVSQRLAALRAFLGRRPRGGFGRLLPLARDPEGEVRREVVRGLGGLAERSDLDAMVDLVAAPAAPGDLDVLVDSTAGALRRLPPAERPAGALLGALKRAAPGAQAGLLRLLPEVGGGEALAEARRALASPEPSIRGAALQALSAWPEATPVEDLLQLAQSTAEPGTRELALRGALRLAGRATEPQGVSQRALSLARTPAERVIVLEGLAQAPSLEGLTLAEPLLDDADPAVSLASARAIVAMADAVRGQDGPRARAVVERVAKQTQDPELRKRCLQVIDQIEKFQGHVLTWAFSGPYREEGKDARALFDAALAPEAPGGGEAAWRRLRRGLGGWEVDLAQALGPADNAAAFLRARIESPVERDVRLELGSDDAIKVWLNGKLVHENFTSRSLQLSQDRVTAHLVQGANILMLKVINISGPWGVSCRLRAADGSALSDLKTTPAVRPQ